MDLLVIIVIAISLSMDAFSLSLAYGTLKHHFYLILKYHMQEKEKKHPYLN